MSTMDVYYNQSWPYDFALRWMQDAYEQVKIAPHKVIVGVGSHDETVITAGRRCDQTVSETMRHHLFRRLDRGGGLTAHEPGQLVLYPILHLERQKLSVKTLVAILEETMTLFLSELGLAASRNAMGPGVFLDQQKIGFIGLRIEEGITKHGLALNVKNDARIFSHFAPCGVSSLRVTSACHHVMVNKPLSVYMELLVKHFKQARLHVSSQ